MKPEDLIGTQVDRYRLQALIGTGGVAAVYRAIDTVTEKRLAIKILFPPPAAGRTLRERFRHEARTVARLDHPGILGIFDMGEADGHPFIAMPLVEGPSLQALLETRGRLDETTAAEIAMQVAQALDYAHAGGVIHRDVKPSNILLDTQGRPLLTDFGVARALDTPSLTATGFSVGTPIYMSPEQASGRTDLDGRADLYSLGVVLYQMVTGHTPFRGSTPQVMHAHVYQPPPAPSSVAEVSPAMEAIILRTLAKDPHDRYATGAALAADLRSLVEATHTRQPLVSAEEPPANARGQDTQLSSPLPRARRAAGGWAVRALAGLLILAVIGGGVWLATNSPIQAPAPSPTSAPPVAVLTSPSATPPLSSSIRPTAEEPSPTRVSPTTSQVSSRATATPSPTSTPTPTSPPSPTSTPSPPPPTFTPTLTPTPCPQPAAPIFDDWLASEASLRGQVGCPRSQAGQAPGAWEPFEGGQMLWRGDLQQVYVLYAPGTWAVYDDEWREGDLEWDPSIRAPDGLYQPGRGFGLVWRERAGVRDVLGWATATEASFNASFQPFERALLIADETTTRAWALLSDGTWLASP